MGKKVKLYQTVYNDILAQIKGGTLKVGDKLPTEIELTKIYGVSRITISRALKELANINLVYRIKKSGSFVNGKLNFKNMQLIISVIMPFHEELNDIAKGIQSIALANNIFTRFFDTRNNIKREREYLTESIKNDLDGLILYPCSAMDNIDLYVEILSRGIPIVCIDRNIGGLETPLVTTTNALCMEQIVDHLVRLGHKKLCFFFLSDRMALTETERFKGFCKGVIKNGLQLKKEYLFDNTDIHKKELTLTKAQQSRMLPTYVSKCLDTYMAFEDKPTAICCVNDWGMHSICTEAEKRGISIPEELTVTGFDCLDISNIKKNHHISVQQNFYGLGAAAINLIIKILNGQQYNQNEYVSGILIT